MKTAVIYIHGKGGSSDEAKHYSPLFHNCYVTGLDYKAQTPWEAKKEFSAYFDKLYSKYQKIILVANSIGAYFAMHALSDKSIDKAFLISPIVDMEKLILDMMAWSNVTEQELQTKKEIPTAFGETLSWEYLSYARSYPIKWDIPTEILYGENDNMTSLDTVSAFAAGINAGLTVMKNGEHWFHTSRQMQFVDLWIKKYM